MLRHSALVFSLIVGFVLVVAPFDQGRAAGVSQVFFPQVTVPPGPQCNVASITKGTQGFIGGQPPEPVFRINADGSIDEYLGNTCLTCHPPANAPGVGRYKTLARWTPNHQFILLVAEANVH